MNPKEQRVNLRDMAAKHPGKWINVSYRLRIQPNGIYEFDSLQAVLPESIDDKSDV